LNFFSRYSFIWKFENEQEEKYDLFVRSSQIASLRLVTFITIFGMSLFLLIDFFKDVDFSVVLITRACVLAIAVTTMWLTYKAPGPKGIVVLVIIITMLNFTSAMVTSYFAGMPSFYMTNLLFLIFVLVVTASGLHFRYALLLNIFCILIFIIYSLFIKSDPFYFSQYPHLFSIFFYIHIVGLVLESRRRRNFLQFNDLMEQKSLVEDLNQQKNKIISILSHDVAAPMNTLSTILYLQSNGNVNQAELKTYLPKLTEQFNNVSALLFGLVRWSRSQMEGFVLDKTTIDIAELAEREIKLFHLQLLDKGLELRLTSDRTAFVKVDEEMIRIAMRNLISNAIKFARIGTCVQVKVFKNDKNKVMICFSNQGEPIPADLVSKLFTYQMPSTPDSKGERGTGLGLAMTAFFVRLNGGDIYLAPSDDGNTTFCIEMQEVGDKAVVPA